MAKKSTIAKQAQREAIVARFAERRAALKETIRSGTDEERLEAVAQLQRLPRDASPVRLRKRCQVDGRPRGLVGKAGVSRVKFRELAHRGELPGITTSSW